MSLKGWIGKRIEARIEAMPSYQAAQERAERLGPVMRAVDKAARMRVDDAVARAWLEEKLAGKDEEVVEYLKEPTARNSYMHDRRYRLLAAVASKSEVE